MRLLKENFFLSWTFNFTKTVLLLFLGLLAEASWPGISSVSAQEIAPYPPSTVIEGISFDWTTHVRLAEGSDNWAITWADDGHQYSTWGDGGGFGGSDERGRVSLGVAKIEGSFEDYEPLNIWGGHNASYAPDFEGKSYGIIFIDGVLYMWVGPGSNTKSYEEARLFHSTNYGATWTAAEWAFVKEDGLIMPTILNFGKNYAGARDNFVYHYFIELQGNPEELSVHIPGKIHLLRVDKSEIFTSKSSYEYFNGLDGNGDPIWSDDINFRQPVFEDANGVGWNLAVSYNAGLERYILTTEHTDTNQGNLGIFDAPEPWGPWTTVAYMNRSDGTQFAHDFRGVPETTFFWNFSNKWLSEDGQEFTLVFTGTDDNDSWNTVRGSFEVATTDSTEPPVDLTPPTDVGPPIGATPPVDVVPPAEATPPVDVIPPTDTAPPTDSSSERETLLPAAPENLMSRRVTTTQISLAWSPVVDPEGGVTNYKVYRDGVLVATLSGITFTDAGLMEGASYAYQVSAVNSNWVEGPKSAPTIRSTATDTTEISIPLIIIGVLLLVGLSASGLFFLARRTR